jgi:hypothetical protein
VLAVPAMAQSSTKTTTTTVTSSTGVPVATASGIVVTPGAPVVHQNLLPHAVLTPAGTTTTTSTMGGPSTTTTITSYWVNVPAWAVNDLSFRRHLSLR